MLITFSSPVYSDITMFGDVAMRLIKMMGHSGTVPSAIGEEDVPRALKRLEAAIQEVEQSPAPDDESKEGEDDEPVVSLSVRAWPLIEMLKAAAKAKSYIMWDSN